MDIKSEIKNMLLNKIGKWYLQGWIIAILFVLFPLILPPFLGIIIIIFQNIHINQFIDECQKLNEQNIEIERRTKELDVRESSMLESVQTNAKAILREKYEVTEKECEKIKQEATEQIDLMNKKVEYIQLEIIDLENQKKAYVNEIEALNTKLEFSKQEIEKTNLNRNIYQSNQLKYVENQLLHIDMMLDGHDFEHYFADLLLKIGYEKAEVTPGSGDFGVDILAERDGIKFAIQCKRYSQPVGVSAVQEVYSGMSHYHCNVGIVVTNIYYTPQAQAHAKAINVVLWDREYISKQLKIIYDLENKDTIESYNNTPSSVAISNAEKLITSESSVKQIEVKGIEAMKAKHSQIGAGKYVFGKNIPLGDYNLKVICGNGFLTLGNENENYVYLGIEDGSAKTYNNLSNESMDWFSLDGNLICEITKSTILNVL